MNNTLSSASRLRETRIAAWIPVPKNSESSRSAGTGRYAASNRPFLNRMEFRRAQRDISPTLAGMAAARQRTAHDRYNGSGNPCSCRCFAGKCGDLAKGRSQSATASRAAAARHGGKKPCVFVVSRSNQRPNEQTDILFDDVEFRATVCDALAGMEQKRGKAAGIVLIAPAIAQQGSNAGLDRPVE